MTDLIKKFVNTEGGLLIEIEGTCSPAEVDCYMLCRDGVVDSGSFTIINACTMPITVTGFTVSDSGRFSLVEYPKYTGSGVYPSGEVPELPIPFTLKPRDKKRINTFFHPYYEELMYGNAGTITSRTGDKFGATVQIYPGFPILNCPGESDCDASVILSGEFICDDKEEDMEWMKNLHNFTDKTTYEMPEISNYFTLTRTPVFDYDHANNTDSSENKFDALSDAIDAMANNLTQRNWKSLYKDLGVSGCLVAVKDHIGKLVESSKNNNFENLINEPYEETHKYGSGYCVDKSQAPPYNPSQKISCHEVPEAYREPFNIDGYDGVGGSRKIFYPLYQTEDAAKKHISMDPAGNLTEAGSATEIIQNDTDVPDTNLPFSYPVWMPDGVENTCEDGTCPNFLKPNLNAKTVPYDDNLSDLYELTYKTFYDHNDSITLNLNGVEYTGMKIDIEGNPAAGFMTDRVLFFNLQMGRAGSDVKMFICEYGNFKNEPIDPIVEL